MTQPDSRSLVEPSRGQLVALVIIFFLSGSAALVYEVVWFQMLELVIGSSAISLGILLGVFMGGMCLGSLLAPRTLARPWLAQRHPLRLYAGIELGIGALGLLMLAVISLAGNIYIALNASSDGAGGASILILRGLITGVCVLPPAMLMGATLPAIARWVETTAQGVPSGQASFGNRNAAWLGLFYGGNLFGAVAGSLLAAFVLLRYFDITVATFVAVALNLSAAALAWISAGDRPGEAGSATGPAPAAGSKNLPHPKFIYASIALSGMTALGCEVVWTRQLALFSGATVFAFSLILAVFLTGLGIGATIGSRIARGTANPHALLAACQALLMLAIGWAGYQLALVLPYWQVDPARLSAPWYKLRIDLQRCAMAALPATLLWGASFPLAVAAAVRGGRAIAGATAWAYGANTLGALAGALGAAFWLIPELGSSGALVVLTVLCVPAALFVSKVVRGGKNGLPLALRIFMLLVAIFSIRMAPPMPPDVLAYGRLVTQPGRAQVLYAKEGIASTVAVSRTASGALNYHGAGKVQASTEYQDMRLQRILGHLTTLVSANARSFLVIGLGAGITAGAVSIEPGMERETIVEIEPLVPEKIAPYFRDYNFDLIHNPRARVVIDDGRHYLLTTRETFDGITSDPLDPWVKGTAALYTREFFELARRRLNPGGVMTQFVQLYESNEDAVRSEIATFFEVFPEGLIFANSVLGQGYDLVLLGQASPTPIDLDALEARLDEPEYARVAKSLEELGFYSAGDLLGTYVARAADLHGWLAGSTINRDNNLRLQYLAGLGLNEKREAPIYNHMLAFGPRFAPEVFKGSESLMEYLKRAIESGSSR